MGGRGVYPGIVQIMRMSMVGVDWGESWGDREVEVVKNSRRRNSAVERPLYK